MSRAGSPADPLAVCREIRLLAVRRTLGPDDWARYLDAVAAWVGASGAALVCDGHKPAPWVLAASGSVDGDRLRYWLPAPDARAFADRIERVGQAVRTTDPLAPLPDPVVGLAMPGAAGQQLWLFLQQGDESRRDEVILRGLPLADVLADAGIPARAGTPPPDDGPASAAIDATDPRSLPAAALVPLLSLLGEVLRARRYRSAGYQLANGLVATIDTLDQVAIGWRAGAYTRVRFISHLERFERKTETVRLLEAALEESVDQDQVIRARDRQSGDSGSIDLAHRQLQTHLGAADVVTLPLHDAGNVPIAAVTLVSLGDRFDARTLASVFFVVQTAIPQLVRLQKDEAGLLRRLGSGLRDGLGRFLGGENLWVKLGVLTLSALLFASVSLSATHQVRGVARFVTDETRLLSAPWAGTIAGVEATSGDTVEAGQPLIVLDTDERLLQLAELQAELQRNLAELDRARAEFNTVDTAIGEARLAQVRARLARLELQINQATLRAPISGVVVEGDRRDLLSATVSEGQRLMRVAEVDGIYLLVEIPEDYVESVRPGSTGRFSLVARPAETIPLVVERLIPLARTGAEGGGAVFEAFARLDVEAAPWWRPGMTGVARIEGERRSLLWIAGHRAWNRLRLWLWW